MWRWLLVAAACSCRGKEAPAPASQAEARPTPGASIPSTPGPRPELAAPWEAGVAPSTPGDRFAAEIVDRGWKARTERELRQRLVHVAGGPPQIECRTSMCQLVLQGTQAEITAAMGDLEKLQDSATHVVLSAPEPSGDKLALRAYLRFERSDLGD